MIRSSMESEAESQCDKLLSLAYSIDPSNAEVLQSEASIRLSQSRPEEAQRSVSAAWTTWRELPAGDLRIPDGETRLQLAKLMLELGSNGDALEVIAGVVAEDDQDVEAWYLEGWCLWGMSERVKSGERLGEEEEGKGKGKEKQESDDDDSSELGWEELARDARDCLETCKMVCSILIIPAPLLTRNVAAHCSTSRRPTNARTRGRTAGQTRRARNHAFA